MPQLLPNTFSSYYLTEQEQTAGSILTELQRCVIQNEIYKSAQLKLNVIVDADNPQKAAQDHAYHQGAIDVLTHLITCSEAATAENLKLAIQTAAQDSPNPPQN